MKSAVALFLALLAFAAPLRADPSREYVIVAGGVSLHQWEKYKAAPHDGWWMNFIRASRIRIQQLRTEDPEMQIAWLVFKPSYITRARQEGRDLFNLIDSVRDAYKVRLIYFDRTEQLVNYLNAGQPRDRVKISGFEFFGHSNRACFMFDYSNNIDSASKVWLHEDELKQISRGIWAKDAYAKSWGCHTGESMSKKWGSATGVKMIGAIGKTQYQTEELPTLSSANGRWTR